VSGRVLFLALVVVIVIDPISGRTKIDYEDEDDEDEDENDDD